MRRIFKTTKRITWAVVFLSAAVMLAFAGKASAAVQLVCANKQIGAGYLCTFRVTLNGATDIAVGRFALSITGPSGVPIPTVEDIIPVTTASGGLLPAGISGGDQFGQGGAGGVFEKILTGLPSRIQAVAGFFLTTGISGSGPIADFMIRVPSGVPVNTTYTLSLTDLDFSDSLANQVEATAVAGSIKVIQARLTMGNVTLVPELPSGITTLVLPPSGAPTGKPELLSGYAVIPYVLEGVEGGASWSIERLPGQESWPAESFGTLQDVSDNTGRKVRYLAPVNTYNKTKPQTVRLRCRSNADPNLTFTVDIKVLPYGDCNLSGINSDDSIDAVTAYDAVLAFRWSLGLKGARRTFDAPSDLQLILGDVSGGSKIPVYSDSGQLITDTYVARRTFGNGQITSSDAVKVFRIQLGLSQVP
ncbi:MAG: hypothetical protein ACP5R4_10625 [Armatimonadota bacterium]